MRGEPFDDLNSFAHAPYRTIMRLIAMLGSMQDYAQAPCLFRPPGRKTLHMSQFLPAKVNGPIVVLDQLFFSSRRIQNEWCEGFRVRLKKEIGGVLAESDGQINAQNT